MNTPIKLEYPNGWDDLSWVGKFDWIREQVGGEVRLSNGQCILIMNEISRGEGDE